MGGSKSNRSYTSPLRNQQKETTRDHILITVAKIISEGHILDFSVKEVADRAGVSYGSVYRHFPTRESLLEGLYQLTSEYVAEKAPFLPQSLDEIPIMAKKTFEVFEERKDIVQAFTIALAANNVQPQIRNERDQKIQQMIMESNPQLTPEATKEVAAVICHLMSSLTWVTLKQRFGLTSQEAAEAMSWSIEALIQALTNGKKG